jgi:hypothetical protein
MLCRETEASNPLGRGQKDAKKCIGRMYFETLCQILDVFAPFPATRKVALCLRIMPSCTHRREVGILKQMVLARHYSA